MKATASPHRKHLAVVSGAGLRGTLAVICLWSASVACAEEVEPVVVPPAGVPAPAAGPGSHGGGPSGRAAAPASTAPVDSAPALPDPAAPAPNFTRPADPAAPSLATPFVEVGTDGLLLPRAELPAPRIVYKRRYNLAIFGGALLLATWAADRLLVADLSSNATSWLPLIGPWYLIQLQQQQPSPNAATVAVLVADGLLQVGGLTMTVLGFVLRERRMTVRLPGVKSPLGLAGAAAASGTAPAASQPGP